MRFGVKRGSELIQDLNLASQTFTKQLARDRNCRNRVHLEFLLTCQGGISMRCFRYCSAALALGAVLVLMGFAPQLEVKGSAQAISTNGGSIQGTVTDPSGAVVPGAQITISNSDTGF